MAGRMEELLSGLSRQLGGALQQMEDMRVAQRKIEDRQQEFLSRLVAIETAQVLEGKYGSETHDGILRRLSEGDDLFRSIKKDFEEATAAVDSQKTKIAALEKALAERPAPGTGIRWRREIAKKLVDILIPMAITGLGWLLYHLHFLAQLAEAAKRTKGGP